MNFKISKKVLYNALSVVSRAISSNSPLPWLSGIKFDAAGKQLILTASDSDISIRKVIDASYPETNLVIYTEGSIVLEARFILEIVRKIDADDVQFEIVDGFLTKISGQSSEFNINGMNPDDYPAIDFNKADKQFRIDADVLLKVITQTSFASSDKETRPVLTGVNFKCDGTQLECVATDSFRLAKKAIEVSDYNQFNITIPAKSLAEVAKTLERDEKVLVCISDRKAQFWIENTVIQTRLIDGAYPETNRLIPTQFDYELVIDSRDLLNAIDRASFIKSEGVSIVRLTMNEREVIMSSRSLEVGSSKEVLKAISYKGPALDISFSGRYVYDAARVLNGSLIKVQFSGEMKPFILRNIEDDQVLQLILPVRTYS